jgi:hypothetical protein
LQYLSMAATESSLLHRIQDDTTDRSDTASLAEDSVAATKLAGSLLPVETLFGSVPGVDQITPDATALEAAVDAAAEASLRIYLVRQDAEAAAMIDEARAAGDALYEAKLKAYSDQAAAATVAQATVSSDSMQLENTTNQSSCNSQSTPTLPPSLASETSAVAVEGCPEPWESNAKFSPCRKFMSEFCTLHGTDPRSRCCFLKAAFLFCFC